MKVKYLSEYEHLGVQNDIPLMCIKFSKNEKNIEQMRRGIMYMNALENFAKPSPSSGMYDELEGGRRKADGTIEYNDFYKYSHMLCFVGLFPNRFIVTECSNGVPTKIRIDKDKFDFKKMKEEFGRYFIPLWYQNLQDSFKKYCDNNKVFGLLQPVIYTDNLEPEDKKRMDGLFDVNDPEYCFYKRKEFENQNEIRMIYFDAKEKNAQGKEYFLGESAVKFLVSPECADILNQDLHVEIRSLHNK